MTTLAQAWARPGAETFTVALFGTVGGLGLGLFLSWALVSALASEGFTAFAIPTVSPAVVPALGALAGVVAAIRPAHRAAGMDTLSAQVPVSRLMGCVGGALWYGMSILIGH